MSSDVIRFDDVTVCYGPKPAVHHLSAVIPAAKLVAVVGPNGGGKSTLLRTIMGWHPLTTGAITVAGVPCAKAAGRISYLPQRAQVDWDFPVTVREVVAMSRYHSLGCFRGFAAADHAAVDGAIAEMGLEAVQQRQIAALSGGQQQRTFLARALASGADIFLLDEPFVGLDARAIADLMRRLRDWTQHGRLVVAVVHDVALARDGFDQALLLRSELIGAGPATEVLCAPLLERAYGRAMTFASASAP